MLKIGKYIDIERWNCDERREHWIASYYDLIGGLIGFLSFGYYTASPGFNYRFRDNSPHKKDLKKFRNQS